MKAGEGLEALYRRVPSEKLGNAVGCFMPAGPDTLSLHLFSRALDMQVEHKHTFDVLRAREPRPPPRTMPDDLSSAGSEPRQFGFKR
jgi:hypothetical protein